MYLILSHHCKVYQTSRSKDDHISEFFLISYCSHLIAKTQVNAAVRTELTEPDDNLSS